MMPKEMQHNNWSRRPRRARGV